MYNLINVYMPAIADEIANPNTVFDWGVISIAVIAVITSIGSGVKKIIEWAVTKITAPDTRIEELELERADRVQSDRRRLVKLEEDVEKLRQEIIALHEELKLSEVARASTEGELKALRRQIGQNVNVRPSTNEDPSRLQENNE